MLGLILAGPSWQYRSQHDNANITHGIWWRRGSVLGKLEAAKLIALCGTRGGEKSPRLAATEMKQWRCIMRLRRINLPVISQVQCVRYVCVGDRTLLPAVLISISPTSTARHAGCRWAILRVVTWSWSAIDLGEPRVVPPIHYHTPHLHFCLFTRLHSAGYAEPKPVAEWLICRLTG